MRYDVYITRQGSAYVADAPALPGCRTIGRSETEVLDNIKSIVRGYKKTLEKKHRRIPKVKVISIREEDHALPRKIT